jgi:hypothetical protein
MTFAGARPGSDFFKKAGSAVGAFGAGIGAGQEIHEGNDRFSEMQEQTQSIDRMADSAIAQIDQRSARVRELREQYVQQHNDIVAKNPASAGTQAKQ